MASLGGDQALLFGGTDALGYNNETWVYDLSANTWTLKSLTTKPSARATHAMAPIGGDQVLLYGGQVAGNVANDETWVYDLSANTWTQKFPATKPSARTSHAMAYLGDDQVLLFGGFPGVAAETWVYDLSDNTWTLKSPATQPSGRYSHAMAYLGDDQALLLGGYAVGFLNAQNWIYDLSDNTWTLKASGPAARYGHGMAYLQGDQALIFGGQVTGNVDNAETWVYGLSADTWAQKFPVTQPSARHAFAMASLNSGQALLFGGVNSTTGNNSETWVYTASSLASPEMDVQGNGFSIADGDDVPWTIDDTDFGNVDVSSGAVSHTFTIKNIGAADLNLTGTPKVQISGPHAANFIVTVQPASPVSSGGTTTFTIMFDPSVPDLHTATVSIDNDDGDENPYDFVIQGMGQCTSPPTANAGADLATATGVSAKIGANPTGSGISLLTYYWSPSTGLSSATVANPTAIPSSTTTYEVTVTDANGCTAIDEVTVRAGNLVNSRIKAVIGPTNVYDPVLNQVRADIAIKNISAAPIYGPLTAVFKTLNPGPPTITIPNANGGGEGLGCYYDYSALLGPDNVLSPGETSGYKLWIFQEHVTPAVNFKFFADIIGDLDGVAKMAANSEDQPLIFSYEILKSAIEDQSISKTAGNEPEIPESYALHQNHPNPFNPSTTISFALPEAGEVSLAIYNLNGQLVRQVASGKFASGRHQLVWDATDDRGERVASGVYLYVIKAGAFTAQKKLVLMK
jgi:N-acetylneuraminic acid mutarotase